MVRLENIRKSYRIGPAEVQVLKDICLDIDNGQMMAVVGPSGCGKSTLMNIIGLLDRPDSGFYLLDNQAISYNDDDRLSELRNQRIGFVFQQYFLLPRLTARENVELPMMYRRHTDFDSATRAMEMLEKVGMADRAQHRPAELSGGQQQRVAIARALMGGPSLVLADEPTGALDTKVGGEIIDLFQELNETAAITMVIITHDPQIAARCGRSAVMQDGKLLS